MHLLRRKKKRDKETETENPVYSPKLAKCLRQESARDRERQTVRILSFHRKLAKCRSYLVQGLKSDRINVVRPRYLARHECAGPTLFSISCDDNFPAFPLPPSLPPPTHLSLTVQNGLIGDAHSRDIKVAHELSVCLSVCLFFSLQVMHNDVKGANTHPSVSVSLCLCLTHPSVSVSQ